jgi:hypothetical protein
MRRFRAGWIVTAIIGAAVLPAVARADLTAPPLDHLRFAKSTQISNQWYPLIPGTQYDYRGQADRDGSGIRSARDIFTVTNVTKMVDGIRSVVVWDRDYSDGRLVEEEIHFFAQETGGNVWSLGEYPEEYEAGQFVGAPTTWLSGVDGAQAGIHIQGNPQLGSAPYVQGIAPAIGFFNAAQVFATGQSTCVPFACFKSVLITNEFSPDEPGAGGAHKYYAPGIGNVRVEPAGSPEMESLQLKTFGALSSSAREQANARVLKLDKRAFEVESAVYGHSTPAQLAGRP